MADRTRTARAAAVQHVFRSKTQFDYCVIYQFEGTEAELIGAGIADQRMLTFGKSRSRHTHDQFGDFCSAVRFARGRIRFERTLFFEEQSPNKRRKWIDDWLLAERAVRQFLATLVRAAQ